MSEEKVEMQKAVLVLQDGTRFEGLAYGQVGKTIGRVTINTAVTGYQEALTAPTEKNILLFTTPHIGNTGVNDTDAASPGITATGIVVRDPARLHSNFRAERSLETDLQNSNVVGIRGIDTRALARKLAGNKEQLVGIFSGNEYLTENEQLLKQISDFSAEGAE